MGTENNNNENVNGTWKLIERSYAVVVNEAYRESIYKNLAIGTGFWLQKLEDTVNEERWLMGFLPDTVFYSDNWDEVIGIVKTAYDKIAEENEDHVALVMCDELMRIEKVLDLFKDDEMKQYFRDTFGDQRRWH